MRIATKKSIGFIDIQDISSYNPKYKYQTVFFKSSKTEPIAKRFKTKSDAMNYAKKLKSKYF